MLLDNQMEHLTRKLIIPHVHDRKKVAEESKNPHIASFLEAMDDQPGMLTFEAYDVEHKRLYVFSTGNKDVVLVLTRLSSRARIHFARALEHELSKTMGYNILVEDRTQGDRTKKYLVTGVVHQDHTVFTVMLSVA